MEQFSQSAVNKSALFIGMAVAVRQVVPIVGQATTIILKSKSGGKNFCP